MPSPMSRKASSAWIGSHVGASTQPCLTPFVTLNDSETSPSTLTFAIIPVCSASIIVVNFSGQILQAAIARSSQLYQRLAEVDKYHVQWSTCSMHFSCSCRRQNIISRCSATTLCLRNYLWCYVSRCLLTSRRCPL